MKLTLRKALENLHHSYRKEIALKIREALSVRCDPPGLDDISIEDAYGLLGRSVFGQDRLEKVVELIRRGSSFGSWTATPQELKEMMDLYGRLRETCLKLVRCLKHKEEKDAAVLVPEQTDPGSARP